MPTLYETIHADPALAARAAVGDDAGIAEALNAPTATKTERISREQLLRWATATGALARLRTAAASSDPHLASLAAAGLALLDAGIPWLSLDAEIVGFLAALQTFGIISADDRQQLEQRATEPTSRAEQLAGRLLTAADISAALAADRPDGRLPLE